MPADSLLNGRVTMHRDANNNMRPYKVTVKDLHGRANILAKITPDQYGDYQTIFGNHLGLRNYFGVKVGGIYLDVQALVPLATMLDTLGREMVSVNTQEAADRNYTVVTT